ncbi:MAG: hypothetical protein KKB02_13525 [Alphaproteobacteria bacterium]|nr:hypothetical protein [Alphaproteobacteria bacterium]
MKAAIIRHNDTPIEIADIDPPAMRDESALIAVQAASVDPIDDILQSGAMKDSMPLSFPHVMGYGVSG